MAGTPRLSETNRLEAFSDAVFAIVLTLLVLDLLPGEHARSASDLLADWPTYLAFLASFLTVGSIWLSHHNAFSRIRRVDPPVLALNLLLLLGAALVPWPTALVAAALSAEGKGADQERFAALVVYAIVTVLIGVPWALVGRHVVRRPELLTSRSELPWMRRHVSTSGGAVVVAVVATALALLSPVAALVLYLVVPAGFVALSLFDREAPSERTG